MGVTCSSTRQESRMLKEQIENLGPNVRKVYVGYAIDYSENKMKDWKVADNFSITVAKTGSKLVAFASKCPHYGAPLSKGIMYKGVVKCPWHGAAFHVKTGEIEDYPGLDCLSTFPLVENVFGRLTVHLGEHLSSRLEKPLPNLSHCEDNMQVFVIVGSGASALVAAQTLRESAFTGRIVMVSDDTDLPYDRTKLSKVLGPPWEDVAMRSKEWYTKAKVEIMLNAKVERIDIDYQEATVDGLEEPLKYDKILIASGMRSRIPGIKEGGPDGIDQGFKNVLTLYNHKDSLAIRDQAVGKVVLLYGSSFIAMELIQPLCAIAKQVIILYRAKRPYQYALGEVVGTIVQRRLKHKYGDKLKIIAGDSIKKLIGNNQEVTELLTTKKRTIPCGLVIFALGGVANTDFIPFRPSVMRSEDPTNAVGIATDRFVVVNEFMETPMENHYACGDVARFPLRDAVQPTVHCGHWGMAQKTGRVAGLSMVGKMETIFNTIPFFWTTVSGMNLRYVGYGENMDNVVIYGDPFALKFCVLYKRAWKVLSACTLNCDPLATQLSFYLYEDRQEPGEVPAPVLKVFKTPPLIGDTIIGMKHYDENLLTEFDLYNQHSLFVWLPRKIRTFKLARHADVEYMSKKVFTASEKSYRFPQTWESFRKQGEMGL